MRVVIDLASCTNETVQMAETQRATFRSEFRVAHRRNTDEPCVTEADGDSDVNTDGRDALLTRFGRANQPSYDVHLSIVASRRNAIKGRKVGDSCWQKDREEDRSKWKGSDAK